MREINEWLEAASEGTCTHHNACSTLSAPKSRPISVPPRREYRVSATLCTAGLKPAPNAPIMPNTVKSPDFVASPIPTYEMMSRKSDTRARLRSNKGEWTSFLIVFVTCVEELEGVWDLSSFLELTRGVVSVGATGVSIMTGFGLNSLITTGLVVLDNDRDMFEETTNLAGRWSRTKLV